MTRQVTDNLFELTGENGLLENTYHVKDLKHVTEKFTISNEPPKTKESPTNQEIKDDKVIQDTNSNKNTTSVKPGRPKKKKRGKVRKTTLAPQKLNEHPVTNTNKENSNNQYKPYYRYITRSKTSQEVITRPEVREEKSVIKKPEERRKVAVKRPEENVKKIPRGRPRKAHVGVGGEPQNTSYVNSAYIGSNFIARVL